MPIENYIGLMSGTSADGVDVVLVQFAEHLPKIIDQHFIAFDDDIRKKIQRLQFAKETSIHQMSTLDIELGTIFSEAINTLINNNPNSTVKAIGSHGQTIQHQPDTSPAYTIQIGNGAVIASSTGYTTITNFRQLDLLAGGRGAPFAPAFLAEYYASDTEDRVIVNIGGIANICYLPRNIQTLGFDCGPGNTLLDNWCAKKFNCEFDNEGRIASSGNVLPDLLALLMADEFVNALPPKASGQEYFNLDWLESIASEHLSKSDPSDILTTLCAFTAQSITMNINKYCKDVDSIYLYGGGIHNKCLISFLENSLDIKMQTTAELGIHPAMLEACVFAWLARQTFHGKQIDLTSITGANKPQRLGCIWPGEKSSI